VEVEHLAGLWRARPSSVPGISLGPARLVVLDADSAVHGQLTAPEWASRAGVRDGRDVLAALFARHGRRFPPNDTLHVATPSGGAHVYYRLPAGLQVVSKPLAAGSLVDVKSRGGYVVAPGSATRAGLYRRTSDVTEPREAPGWLLAYLTDTGHIPSRATRPTGKGHDSLPARLPADAVARRVQGIGERLAGACCGRHAAIATASTALAHLVAAGQLDQREACQVLIEAAVAAYEGTGISARRAERDARDAWASALKRAGA
jgi:hypothetical protein